MLTPAIRAILINSCQLRAANVNSTLYLNLASGESQNDFFRVSKPSPQPCPGAASTLALLVLFFTANHEQHALAPHDFAVSTDLFY
jgi:hypothetical protein